MWVGILTFGRRCGLYGGSQMAWQVLCTSDRTLEFGRYVWGAWRHELVCVLGSCCLLAVHESELWFSILIVLCHAVVSMEPRCTLHQSNARHHGQARGRAVTGTYGENLLIR